MCYGILIFVGINLITICTYYCSFSSLIAALLFIVVFAVFGLGVCTCQQGFACLFYLTGFMCNLGLLFCLSTSLVTPYSIYPLFLLSILLL